MYYLSLLCPPVTEDLYDARVFLKEVVDAFRFLAVRFSLEYLSTVSRKMLTKDLKDILFPVPRYRSMYCKGPGQNVLSRVKKMVIPASVKTFFL